MITLSHGTIPDDLTIDEPYPMELNAADEKTVAEIVNVGIDAHLEAVFCNDKGIVDGKHHLEIKDSASMRCFLRRCVESEDENANDLASCIMLTLGYEWTGT